ncbi:zinc metallopeptidase [Cyclobacteriaceae bacterium]|nr:zinc metallopeptidase [Cyclobacteriaceae bacterium]
MLFIIIIGFMIASWVVSKRLKNKFKKYSQTPLSSNLTGNEIAQLMLRDNGILDVQVISVEGQLTDHYNPEQKTVNLSADVFHGRSAAAAAVAAHECGHAVQHLTGYKYLNLRSAMVPVQNISAKVINFIFLAMFFGSMFMNNLFSMESSILVIIACYTIFTLFAFLTLPVEYDASKRALAWIQSRNIVTESEHTMAKDALETAAQTYLIAALSSLATLFYWVMIYLGGSRD